MAHLLLIEAPGGNDFDLFETALSQGHEVSFFTADISYYQANGLYDRYLGFAKRIVEIKPFDYQQLELQALEIHEHDAFDAVLCLIDIRIIAAAKLAQCLKLRFVNPETATMMRDKYTVRAILASKGIPQPEFVLATDNQQLRAAVEQLGFPVVVKPSDGYGSQNIALFLDENDLNPLIDPLDYYLPCKTDYGFGVSANDRLLVERYIEGQLIGCDTFTQNGRHQMLGINEKLMFAPPSCAIKGSCFPSDKYELAPIRDYVFSILDALGFNEGATHTEIILTENECFLVEVNPRLVGANIPRLLNLALDRCVHNDLINLHLGKPLPELLGISPVGFAVSRWMTTESSGQLDAVILPVVTEDGIKQMELMKKPGDRVGYPYQNADRIGYVMTLAKTRQQAEQLANTFISEVIVKVL